MDDDRAAEMGQGQTRATRRDREMGLQFAIQSLAGTPHSPGELFGLADQIGAYLRGEPWPPPMVGPQPVQARGHADEAMTAVRQMLRISGTGPHRYDDIARSVAITPETAFLVLSTMCDAGEVATDDGISYRILMTADQVAQG